MTELYDLLFKSPEGVTLACDMLVIGTMLAISAAQNITNYQQQKYDAEAAAKKQDQNADLQQQMTQASGAKAMLDFASDSANIAGDYKGKRGAFAEG